MAIKGYSAFSNDPALLEPCHQIIQCHIEDTCWGGSYSSAEVRSVYSVVPVDWINRTLVESLLCRDAVSVFCRPIWLGTRTLFRRLLPLFRDAVSVFCCPSPLGHFILVRVRVLLLCRDAVSVFYSLNRFGLRTLVGGGVLLLCRDAVSVFCRLSLFGLRTLVGGGLTPLQKCSQCIL